jgi:hypothetical protein
MNSSGNGKRRGLLNCIDRQLAKEGAEAELERAMKRAREEMQR